MDKDYPWAKLQRLMRSSSRRNKVFIRRAKRAGWTTEGIISAVRFGAQHFKLMDKGH